jgi:uncharacterized membrane protein YebE (DUF533 family)
MTKTRIIAAALVLSALSVPALANSQQDRINQGIRSGELTRSEVASLRAEQARIAALEDRARRDGRIDPHERREIERARQNASRNIYAEKHDGEKAGNGGYRPYRWWNRYEGHGRRWW